MNLLEREHASDSFRIHALAAHRLIRKNRHVRIVTVDPRVEISRLLPRVRPL
jgi:hypothetical protein